jgi:uncharacterized protein
VVVIYFIMGGNPADILNSGGDSRVSEYRETEDEKELMQFVAVVLAETEDTWTKIFAENRASYRKPVLVVYTERVESACGIAGSATGPFYCPG